MPKYTLETLMPTVVQKHYNANNKYFALLGPYCSQVYSSTVPGCWDPRVFVLVKGGDVPAAHPAVLVDRLGRLLRVAQITFGERTLYNSQYTKV